MRNPGITRHMRDLDRLKTIQAVPAGLISRHRNRTGNRALKASCRPKGSTFPRRINSQATSRPSSIVPSIFTSSLSKILSKVSHDTF